jgi:glucokinase-like ROK family protein
MLALVENARQVIGIDLASDEFRGALVNLRGIIQHRVNYPIDETTGEKALEVVYKLIDELIKAATQPIVGIGIGAPGIMDTENGIVITAVNLDWENLPLVEMLQEKFDFPVYIANDSQVSAMAEFKFGKTESSGNLLVVKIGRGVGSGIILNNELFQGDGFGAGEIGHIKIEDDGLQCRCGKYGCLETRISSRAIRKAASNLLSTSHFDGRTASIEEVYNQFDAGSPSIPGLIEETGNLLGQALSYITSTLNINQIVIAGSVSIFGEGIIDPARKVLCKNTLPAITRNIEISSSALGIDIVILGAAGLVLHHEMNIL